MIRRLFAAAGGALLACVAATALVAPASAADLGGLDVVPAKGTSQNPLSVVTERGCTEPAKRVSAIVTGPGFPSDGQVVMAPSQVLLSTTQPMELPLSNAFVIYAQRNNTALNGTYTITVRCTDRIGVTVLDTFSTTMTWRTPGNKAAKADRATFVAKNTAGVVASQEKAAEQPGSSQPGGSEPGATAAPQGGTESPGTGQAPGATSGAQPPGAGTQKPLANQERPDGSNPDAEKAVATPDAAASSNSPESSTSTWLVLGLAALALVAAVLIFFRGRGSTTS